MAGRGVILTACSALGVGDAYDLGVGAGELRYEVTGDCTATVVGL